MPRQPFLPKYANHLYRVGIQAIWERPHLAAHVGKCVASWSWVDNEISNLFAILLGAGGSQAAHRVFAILRRWSNQREALDAAAELKLTGDNLAFYRVIIKEYGSLQGDRNYLAHGCFGICADDPSLLLVISLEHHTLWQTEILSKKPDEFPPNPHEGLKNHLFVYRTVDLEKLHSQIEQLWWDLFYFNCYLRDPSHPVQLAEFRKRFESPRIQQRISAPKQNSPQSGA
jgi:hypothetical protein